MALGALTNRDRLHDLQDAVLHSSSSCCEPGFWTTSRRIGAALVGLATIAGAVFAAIEIF